VRYNGEGVEAQNGEDLVGVSESLLGNRVQKGRLQVKGVESLAVLREVVLQTLELVAMVGGRGLELLDLWEDLIDSKFRWDFAWRRLSFLKGS
jgi:hypothetical protein